MNRASRAFSSNWLLSLPIALLGACGGGGGSSSAHQNNDLVIADVSVTPFAVWELNRPIDISFNKEIDFDTVNFNTIHLAATNGIPATGAFSLLPDGRTVRFQPSCPTLPDNSDAGLKPGGVQYRLQVAGSENSGVTVRSLDGSPLEVGISVDFLTPDSTDAAELFLDTVAGPPAPRVRGHDGVALDDPDATYLELGGSFDNRVYFVWNKAKLIGELEVADMKVPLNLYSRPEEQVAVVLSLNQPINPAATNVSTTYVQLEYKDAAGDWVSVGTRLTLIANCTEAGSSLRLEPIGLLPQGSDLRVIVREGFGDLTGDKTLLDLAGFAQMTTATAFDPGTETPGDGADELLEPFTTSALEDTTAAFATPPADWDSGLLSASFPFGGTGGPNGNFDWHIPPGTDFILNTTSATITGGPGGDPTNTESVINGVVDIRDLRIPPNSTLIIQGPNICTILATGSVIIEGRISVDGSSSKGVGTLNTTNQPEPGASGNAGGGKGGTGSYLTNQSTPRGGAGWGAFNVSNGGGQGGETSYSSLGIIYRRAAGGGGGTFGPDVYYSYGPGLTENLARCQELIGLDVEHGCGGGPDPAKGAESQTERAQGGFPGPRPFTDGDDTNDFLGTMLTADQHLILGELDHVWAAGGGGAGGNSVDSDSFPLDPWSNTGDEKGAGGGGGAGGLRILALGQIEVHAPNGSITANGGQGGGGENPSSGGFSHVGGGSAGGGGGHIVLSSASYISVEGFSSSAGEWFNDYVQAGLELHYNRPISAVGGQGGSGKNDKGGSSGGGAITTWRCDAIPFEYFEEATGEFDHNPPRDDGGSNNCWSALPDLTDPLGPVIAAGGDGGPGIIQFHVDDPALNLRFPDITGPGQTYGAAGAAGIDVSKTVAPPPVGWKPAFANEASDIMIPFFGKESTAQSKWIALGLARVNPAGGNDQVMFFFGGTDPSDGTLLRDGEFQQEPAPLLGPVALATSPNPPYIDPDDPLSIVLDASSLVGADDVYKRNAALVRLYTLRLQDSADATILQDHQVSSATYDPELDQLRLTVFPVGEKDLTDFVPTDTTMVSLLPYFLQVTTGSVPLAYPEDSEITTYFEATTADSEGNPNESATTGLVTDITDLNLAEYDFFRFRVHFNLSKSGAQVTGSTPKPAFDFFRVPFRF
jgi:hypothetical protein